METPAIQAARLADVMSAESLKHLASLEQDVAQLQLLLDASITDIGTGFLELAQLAALAPGGGSSRQDGAPEGATADPQQPMAAALERVGAIVANLAIQLQFHDLTTQVLEHSAHRIDGLQKLILALRSNALVPNQQRHGATRLKRMAGNFERRSRALDRSLRRRVQQINMQPGTTDLF